LVTRLRGLQLAVGEGRLPNLQARIYSLAVSTDGETLSLPRLQWRPSYLWPSLITLLLGVGVVVYRGPGRWLIRGYIGDVLVVAFLYFVLGLFLRSVSLRLSLVFGLAVVTELRQWIVQATQVSLAEALTVGATADPFDILAYMIGLLLALGVERKFLLLQRLDTQG
jgi:hypothetical protein